MVTSYSILPPPPLPINLSPIQFCVGAVVRLGNGKINIVYGRGVWEKMFRRRSKIDFYFDVSQQFFRSL